MKKGKLIVIEGTDCSGKETQSKLLEENLKKAGYKCFRMSFPKYDSPTGKIVGGCYLGKVEIGPTYFKEGTDAVDPKVSCLYYAADRKYNMPEIQKYLDDDYYVILDRYTTSNMAHQGGKIKDKDERFNVYQWIDKLEYWLLGLPKPDVTIFLYMPYTKTAELMKNREYLDENEKNPDHLKHAAAAYVELSELYNWDRINCVDQDGELRSIEDISKDVLKVIVDEEEN